MSRPHDLPHPFFHFGNPFQMISPKGSNLSKRLLLLLNNFEETLTGRLRKLNPEDKDGVLSLSWIKLAMLLLCETHNDIKTLIAELELPVCDWDEKWIDAYLDINVNLLDIYNAFNSEISRLNQGHLLLQCVLHNLDSNSSKQIIKNPRVENCRQHISSKNPRVENYSTILNKLVESLDLPNYVKYSAKGKVLMRATYGVKVKTLFICSAFALAFSGFARKLFDLNGDDKYMWAQAFSGLQTSINSEIRNLYSNGRFTVLKELEAVDTSVKKLYPMIQDGVDPIEVEAFQNFVSDLARRA
uniref:BPS1-like protein n=1 Tax=Quercus lobata TaxID=97700 RepID=A0A7N2LGG7_QUELO